MKWTTEVMAQASFLSGARAGESPPGRAEDLQTLNMQRQGLPRRDPIFAQICCTASWRAL